MPKTIACLVIKTPRVFTWLGHMPILNWSLTQLQEVRGIDRIVCVADPALVERAAQLLAKDKITVAALTRDVVQAKEEVLDDWLVGASGPASDANFLVVSKATSPFMPCAKIEACIREVTRGKCSVCLPTRSTTLVTMATFKQAESQQAVDGFRVRKVNVPREARSFRSVRVNLMESLDVTNADEFVMASALVESDKI